MICYKQITATRTLRQIEEVPFPLAFRWIFGLHDLGEWDFYRFKKMQTITEWNISKSICNVQCFHGFVNFYKVFIKDCFQDLNAIDMVDQKGKNSSEIRRLRKLLTYLRNLSHQLESLFMESIKTILFRS